MNIRFLAPAERELNEAIDYYNEQRQGLGFELAAELERALDRIRQFPDAWPALSDNTRRCQLNRFPYGLVYTASSDEITIIAVMHLSRHPESWRGRL